MRHRKFFALVILVLLLILVTGCAKSSPPRISDGKIASIEFKLGSDMKEVTDKLGKPSNQGQYNNKDFLKYGDTAYFFGINSHKLSAIGTGDKTVDVFGVKVGMSIAEIKKVLGEPEKEFQHNEDDEWIMVYSDGENQLLITSNTNNDPVKYIELRTKNIDPADMPKPAPKQEFKSTFKLLGAQPETDKYGNTFVVGVIQNESNVKYEYAIVEFDVVSQHGGQLAPIQGHTLAIQPHGTANFKILCSYKTAQYFSLKSIKGLVAN